MHHYISKRRKISKKKEQEVYEEDQNRISNLPNDILLHILSFMHVKLAARTSVLSMRWRSLWTCHSSLDFSYWKPTQIDQCLHLHRAPKVRSFNIMKSDHDDSPTRWTESHRWVSFAATRKVEELSLVLPLEFFPLSLFECQTLSHLILKQGVLCLNGEFGGFKSLVTLCLEDVWINNEGLKLLISKCELLENLKVAKCRFIGLLWFKICANHSSRLRNLEIIFDGTKLEGLEVVAPGILFISSRGELPVPPSSYPHLSWEANAEGWRCRESSISCVKEKNMLVGDWLSRVQLGVSLFLNMRNMGRTFFCRILYLEEDKGPIKSLTSLQQRNVGNVRQISVLFCNSSDNGPLASSFSYYSFQLRLLQLFYKAAAGFLKVEELSLGLLGEEFPASLLECQTLSQLMLQDVNFDPSGDLGAFKSLVTLCLHGVIIKNDVFNMLISTCDLLENLQVTECIFGEVLRRRNHVTNHSKLRNFDVSFYCRSLLGLEIVAPDFLFLSCRRGNLWGTCIPPLSLSWNDDAVDWRRRVSSKGKCKICVKDSRSW